MRSISSETCKCMRSCWRVPPQSTAVANPSKRPTIPSSTGAPSCWIPRSWRRRDWRRAGRSRGSRNWRRKLSRLKVSHRQARLPTEEQGKLGKTLNLDGGAIGEDFGDTLHHFGGVIAQSDHGVGFVFAGVVHHQFKSIFSSLLAEVGENGDVSTDDGLKRRAEIPDHAPRAHDNSAHDSKISDDPVAGKFER